MQQPSFRGLLLAVAFAVVVLGFIVSAACGRWGRAGAFGTAALWLFAAAGWG